MDLNLTKDDREVQARAREFVENHLFPCELECEENDGLSQNSLAAIRKAAIEYKVVAMNHSPEDGGQGYDVFQQMLAHEQLGKATNALWDVPWQPALPLRHATPEQKAEYLRPACAGERRDAYAITEAGAGSDPRQVETTAVRRNGKYYLSGEKWFVTVGDIADFLLVHCHVDGDADKPTVFLVDKDLPGVSVKRQPKYMHTFVFEHPEFVFENVELDESKILGGVGEGLELTKDWFTDARLHIAAHCVGAATRATEIANDYAAGRVQFGKPIRDFQAIEFMLADMAVEIMATKSMVYRACWEIAQGTDRKLVHARASAVKLYASEMAGRVVDRAVQILGGRGYMRENPVERLYREMRVERIWEGTSEIQRMIIGNQIKKRGLDVYTGWV
ncbi:MAG: acyl-CoA dehydrogenase family protein [Alphaproteobacteria bacterium]